jgi:hypothetical protein
VKLTFPKFDAALVEEIEAFLDQPYQTEITGTEEHSELGITYTRARGFTPTGRPGTRGADQYARPMFQLIQDRAFSGCGPRGTLCQCGDFAYSWNCPEHDELPWDSKARRWIRPAADDGVRLAYWTPEPPPAGLVAMYQDAQMAWSPPSLADLLADRLNAAEINTDGLVFRGIRDAVSRPDAFDVDLGHPVRDADSLATLLDSMQAQAREAQRRLASLPAATISIRYTAEPEDGSADTADRVVHIQIETEGGGTRGR